MLGKFTKTLRVFAKQRPSVRDLWVSREGSFDRVHAIVPSEAVIGEPVSLTVQTWDEYERLHPHAGAFDLDTTDDEANHPGQVRFHEGNEGLRQVEVIFESPGIQYVTLLHPETGERFVSNPVRVSRDEPELRTYWGDIHLHSVYSDGAGRMASGIEFGRDVMQLDVVSYTDHDTMGFFIPPSWHRRRMHDRYFEEMKTITEEFYDPGEFVTLFGYEWTKQPNKGGHINVYFSDVDEAELFDSIADETQTPEDLWARLREWRTDAEGDVLTIPHHPAEEMYPFDFSAIEYDDDLAPLVEVYSQWGSSEYPGSAGNRKPLQMGQGEIDAPGHYVQDALALDNRVGMLGGSDYHGPHPGHSLIHAKPHLPSFEEWRRDGIGWGLIWRIWNEQSYRGGLTAFRAPDLTRESIFDALRSRRVYATTQPDRILVDLSINGVPVGEQNSTVTIDEPDAEREVRVSMAGTAPLEAVELVKNNDTWRRFEAENEDDDAPLAAYTLTREVSDETPVEGIQWDDERGTDDDVYYLRVTQVNGGMAWVGPLWVTVDD